jgi:hypothetical protein
MTQQPKLKRLANRKYQCDDIAALHAWLEAQGYDFYGRHAMEEYGRFSHQEAHDQGNQRSFSNGYIQILNNGEIYSPDPHAWHLLDMLVDDGLHERSV